MNKETELDRDFKDSILDSILREQVCLVMQQLPTMQIASFVVALVLSFTVRNLVSRINIFAWVLIMVAIVLSRIVLYYRFVKVREGPFDGKLWEKSYLILAIMSGSVWGLSAFIIYPAGHREVLSLFVLVIASLTAATTVSHSAIRMGPTGWAVPAMLPYAIRCVMEKEEYGYTIALLIVIYLLTIIRYSFSHNKVITNAISLKFENLGLLEEVQRVNEALRRDIDQRRQAELMLKESEARFRGLIERAPVAISISRGGTTIYVNHKYLILYGFQSLDELVGQPIFDQWAPESREMVRERVHKRALGEIVPAEYEGTGQRKDGSQFPVHIVVETVDLPDGPAFIAFLSDITERKKAEEALRVSERQYRQLVDNALVGVYKTNLDGRFLYANEALAKIFECESAEEVLRLPVVTLYKKPEDREAFLNVIRELGKVPYYELEVVAKTGKLKTIVISASLEEGVITGTITDITERKHLEAQLRQAQKMEAIGTLTGGIAHDFNNILNVIIGFSTMVQDSLEASSASKEQMNEVHTAAEKAVILIRRLLAFSRRQAIEVKPLNINELVLGLQKMLVRIIGEDIDLQIALADTLLVVLADPGQIEQVLMNLATNARDAMPEGGALRISTGLEEIDDEYVVAHGYGKPGNYALIMVSDTGGGIDEETQKKMFEPFYTTKGVGEGTGLGLSISYGIVKQHGGYINVYSEVGQGTVFKIYLPLMEEAAVKDKEAEASHPAMGGSETILVAEDDESLRNLIRIVLESSGYRVVTAEDGEDAIRKFMDNREKIALVVLDMIMPKKSGKEVSEVIRKVSPGIKILFTSGYAVDTMKTEELAASGFDFIQKPVMPQRLLSQVREVLDR